MFSEKIELAVESKYNELCGEYRQRLEDSGLTLTWVLAETQIERVHANLLGLRDAVSLIKEAEQASRVAEERAIALIMGI